MKTENTYQVIVGNVGSIFIGSSYHDALQAYSEAKGLSFSGHGRWANEEVILMKNDEPLFQYTPKKPANR